MIQSALSTAHHCPGASMSIAIISGSEFRLISNSYKQCLLIQALNEMRAKLSEGLSTNMLKLSPFVT